MSSLETKLLLLLALVAIDVLLAVDFPPGRCPHCRARHTWPMRFRHWVRGAGGYFADLTRIDPPLFRRGMHRRIDDIDN